MDMPINTFKRAIKEGRQQIGLWSSLSSHISVEILAGSGFDWLLIDTEHSPNDLPMVYSQLQAAVGGTAHPIVRVPWNDMVTIKRYLDAGPNLLIPYVQNEEEARQAVASTRYPPDGVRGFASASRASRFGRVKDYYARAAEEICVLVQIETREALGHLEAIASVRASMACSSVPATCRPTWAILGQPGHPDVTAAIDDAIGRIRGVRERGRLLTGDENLARHFIEKGRLFTAVGSDVGLLVRSSEQLAAKFRNRA